MGLEKIRTPKVDLMVRFQCEACFTDQTVTIDQRWDVVSVDGSAHVRFACEVSECRTEHEIVLSEPL